MGAEALLKARGLPVPGDVLAGKYRIERLLAQGGMSVLFAAHHDLLDLRVAIKVLSIESPDSRQRFLNEGRAAARIHNEHVARIFDVGVLDNGVPYMVIEMLEGTDLAAHVDAHGPMPIAEAVDAVLQAIEGVSYAHARGIVHRDLKPGNLFLERPADGPPRVKVLDFGISKSTGLDARGRAAITSDEAIMGSPAYMSPEQVKSSKDVDVRADVWSFGVVLYELLTGASPFNGETVGAILAAVLEASPASMRSVRADVPPALEAAVARCLMRARAERFADVGMLAEAIAPFGSGRWTECVERARTALARSRGDAGSSGSYPSLPQVAGEPPVAHRTLSGPGAVVRGAPPIADRTELSVATRERRVRLIAASVGGFALAGALAFAAVLVRSRTHAESAVSERATPSASVPVAATDSAAQAPPASASASAVADPAPPPTGSRRPATPTRKPTKKEILKSRN